jgi:LPS-assembly protein
VIFFEHHSDPPTPGLRRDPAEARRAAAGPAALAADMLRLTFLLAISTPLFLTTTASAQDFSNCSVAQGISTERRGEGHSLIYGSPDIPVQLDCKDMQFMANFVERFADKDLVVAQGNVVFDSGGTRISADRMEFNMKSRTGTFYNAWGTTSMGDRGDRSMFGTQEPDAYFWGAEIHKLGPKKYRLVRGNFTTCVQPAPRWDVGAGSITINLDDYALFTNSVFRVKHVPVMYLPVFYYPIQEDDRATGFLMPIYGASTLQGQKLTNQFFWAIGRSHDATIFHDWFSKTGQGIGGEYRYVLAPGSQGNSTVSFVNEHETKYPQTNQTIPARRSYAVRGDLVQRLPLRLRARGNVDFFSSITTQQRYQQDLFRSTSRTRRFGGNVTGSWGSYIFSATADRNDTFYDQDFVTSGNLPRVIVSRSERPIPGTPLYFGVNGEYVTLLRSVTRDDVKVPNQDQGLTRLDIQPVLRIPFTRWPFLTANSVVAWRGTYWTESLVDNVQVPDALGRQYFDFQTRITGPVFNRIWNTPGNGYAQKFKHVVEPTLTIQRVTAIDSFDRTVKLEGTDYERGNVTRYTYGISNRLYAKKDISREIVRVAISQTYYTDANSALYDRQYQSSFSSLKPTHLSPVALQVRTSPTDTVQADFRTEWDLNAHALRTLAAAGTFRHSDWLSASGGWSQRRFIKDLPGFNDPARADHYLNAAVNLRGARNQIGGSYAFNYDLRRNTFLQQRYNAYYNAQCCGIGIEYQTFNFQGIASTIGVPQDRRFNLSFTLAGIGTFSNLFGAFGGQDR